MTPLSKIDSFKKTNTMNQWFPYFCRLSPLCVLKQPQHSPPTNVQTPPNTPKMYRNNPNAPKCIDFPNTQNV